MTILEKYNRYLTEPTISDEMKEELRQMSDEEINDAFYRELEFGTAGLRGILGPGSNRLNIYVIRKATVGFAQYLLGKYGWKAKTNGVVISHDNRLCSREFAVEAARTLSSYGITSYLFDSLRPTPELSYAVRKAKAMGGIMIIGGVLIGLAIAFTYSACFGGEFTIELKDSHRLTNFISGVIMALCMSGIGFMDDYVKVVKKRNLGLTAKQKTFLLRLKHRAK